MVRTDDIIEFIINYTSIEDVNENSDIYDDLDLVGDDFHDFIDKFALKYKVDMSDYLWYFHGDEEGINLGGILFRPPYGRVKRIPVTPKMLAAFANNGRWEVYYPEHRIPKKRYDIFFNQVMAVVLLLIMAALLAVKYLM